MYAPEPKLYYSASARIAGLKDDIGARRLVTYPSDAPKNLLTVLAKACDRLQDVADIHLADWNGPKDKESIENALGFLNTCIGKIGEYLSVFDTVGFDKAQPAIALPLELLVHHHIPDSKEHNHQFIFHATHTLNFFYIDFYRELRKFLLFMDPLEEGAFFEDLPEHIALVSLAAIERDNIFALIILLHELAHYYDRSQVPPLSQVTLRPTEGSLREWVEEAKSINYVPDVLAKRFPDTTKSPPEVLEFWLRYTIVTRVATAQVWLRELIADMVAARMGGVAFYLTLKKFLSLFPFKVGGDYPPNYRRYHAVAEMLVDPADGTERALDPETLCARHPEFKDVVARALESMRADYQPGDVHAQVDQRKPAAEEPPDVKKAYLEYRARQLLENVIRDALQQVAARIKRDFPAARCCTLSDRMLEAASYLVERTPPAQRQGGALFETENSLQVEEVLCAAWISWLKELADGEPKDEWIDRRNVTSRLALRGVELSDYLRRHVLEDKAALERRSEKVDREVKALGDAAELHNLGGGGVVGRRDLLAAMTKRPLTDRLVIMPLLDADQIGEASIDLRLGNGFIVVRQTRTTQMEVTPSGIKAPGEFKEQISIPYDKSIALHPGEFMLGSVLEYVCLPRDMMAYVIGRSSLGRLGLIIATATHVAPGYRGTLTLELSNVGTVPIKLQPRIAIAQLVFHYLQRPVDVPYHRRGNFVYAIGPTMPKLQYLDG